MKRNSRASITLLAGALALSPIALASVIPTNTGVSGPVGGLYTFSYDAQLDNQQYLVTGSEFCISAIPGLSGTPTGPAGWTLSDSSSPCSINSGVIVANTGASFTAVYTGATLVGPSDLGTFTFQSIFGGIGNANLAYGAVAQKISNNTPTANQGQVNGPTTTPEPVYSLFIGLGLAALSGTKMIGVRRRRREGSKA